ncbi:uncharacterized protein METZ01_LOCUS99821 [marine metagenome]|uniref:Uncharacterized protein n=1 Tax=marine metagenome TaxID=408172 RepID=A0A381W4V0_9ZZZZ
MSILIYIFLKKHLPTEEKSGIEELLI